MTHNEQRIINRMELPGYAKSVPQLHTAILERVNAFVHDFQTRCRFELLSEGDIQAGLTCELARDIPNRRLDIYDEENPKPLDANLGLITCGYPSGKRFDIACIHPWMIKPYFEWQKTNRHPKPVYDHSFFRRLPLLAGIEIQYVRLGLNPGIKAIEKDYQKLREYKMSVRKTLYQCTGHENFSKDFRYLALRFYQDPNALVSRVKVPENDHTEYRKTHGIHHYDRIYLIGKKAIFTCSAVS